MNIRIALIYLTAAFIKNSIIDISLGAFNHIWLSNIMIREPGPWGPGSLTAFSQNLARKDLLTNVAVLPKSE